MNKTISEIPDTYSKQNKRHEISRDLLYELVWSFPLTVLAKHFGISDRGLGKACERAHIPLPGRGFWAKEQAGYDLEKKPLPECPEEYYEYFHFTPNETSFPADLPKEDVLSGIIPFVAPITETDFAVPIIKKAQKYSTQLKPDRYGRICARFGVKFSVHPKSVDRALRFLDALIKSMSNLGHKHKTEKNEASTSGFVVNGSFVSYSLVEKSKQQLLTEEEYERRVASRIIARDSDKYKYVSTGVFTFSIDSYWVGNVRKSWSDTPNTTVEDQIAPIIYAFQKGAENIKEAEKKRKQQEQEWERERLDREAERRRQKEEQERLDALIAETDAWITACNIRQYVDALYNQAKLNGAVNNDLKQWVEWASEKADEIDPLNQKETES
ncbi:MAG: hypothetical protein OEZ68_02425 [Gammaproteobacteria bacterium]|nr:hypothetical protein [Gammaproteobacteria bacterium]MDH5799638.1 hypothetical protein [Gammaproteobacteria bacterium]